MVSDEIGRQLHDRETRNEVLTPVERSQLKTWYAAQDEQESELFQPSEPSTDNAHLQAQIDTALAQLTVSIQRIQQITSDNEALRSEITLLRHQLTSAQSA